MWGILIFAGLVVVGYVAYQYSASLALSSGCANKVLSEIVSPDERYIATVFERSCGATTPYTRIVSVRFKGASFDAASDTSWVFETEDQPTIRVQWLSREKLSVETDGYSRTPKDQRIRLARWRDVEVAPAQ
jgi:hypothetical protein